MPCGFLSLTLGGGTAPATLAGNLVVNAAAVLADLVLLQLASPGAPVFFAAAPSVMDLRTGGYTGGGPEDDVLAAAATQLGHSFGLPVNMGTMATGAKEPGWQAGVDDALSTAASVLAGADMMSGAGLLDGSCTLSYPHLVMETEIQRIVARLAEGIVVDDETLALDAIGRVGPNGTYLADRHTRRHAREIWQPAIWDRMPYDAWLAGGRHGALEAAGQRAREILRVTRARAAARRPCRRARRHRRAGRPRARVSACGDLGEDRRKTFPGCAASLARGRMGRAAVRAAHRAATVRRVAVGPWDALSWKRASSLDHRYLPHVRALVRTAAARPAAANARISLDHHP